MARLHKQLLGENALHQLPGLRRNLFQMSVRIHADEAAEAHARADEKCKTPPIGAISQLDIVRPTSCEHRIFADGCAGLVGDLAAAYGGFKERIGKAERQTVRSNAKGIIQYHQRAVQQLPRAQRQLPEIILRKEFLQQRLGIARFPAFFLHGLPPSSACAFGTSRFFFVVSAASCFCKRKS